jgi:hypothetical protein
MSSILRTGCVRRRIGVASGRYVVGPHMYAKPHHMRTSVAAVGFVGEQTEVVAERPARNRVAEGFPGDD